MALASAMALAAPSPRVGDSHLRSTRSASWRVQGGEGRSRLTDGDHAEHQHPPFFLDRLVKKEV